MEINGWIILQKEALYFEIKSKAKAKEGKERLEGRRRFRSLVNANAGNRSS